jgi:acyl-CoA reductase-like NAD-dependent aldehyde dehydrogenase
MCYLQKDTDLGPIVNASGLKTIDSQVKDSVKEGAEILTGGEQIGSKGYFYKPTVLKNVTPNMRMGQEEVFGPAAPIMVADDEIEAVRLGRELSRYGMLEFVNIKSIRFYDQLVHQHYVE